MRKKPSSGAENDGRTAAAEVKRGMDMQESSRKSAHGYHRPKPQYLDDLQPKTVIRGLFDRIVLCISPWKFHHYPGRHRLICSAVGYNPTRTAVRNWRIGFRTPERSTLVALRDYFAAREAEAAEIKTELERLLARPQARKPVPRRSPLP
jgi:hypothetical protein